MRNLLLWSILLSVYSTQAFAQADAAIKFGSRESIGHMSISPDGANLAYLQPIIGQGSALLVSSVDGGTPKLVMKVNGNPLRLSWCNWASNTRLVCALYGLSDNAGLLLPFTRLIAVNSDGSQIKQLGQRASISALGIQIGRAHV